MLNSPTLPIRVNDDIVSSYVKIEPDDVIYTNFETSRLLTYTIDDNLTGVAFSITAGITSSNSGYFYVTRQLLYNEKFESTYTALTSDIGIYAIKKRHFDCKIENGTFTATVTGTFAGDYFDSGSGELKRKDGADTTIGVFLNNWGMMVVTSTSASLSSIVQAVTSVKYKAVVEHTELSVFCRCNPNELNFTLNPTAFNLSACGDYMKDPFTASTSASQYFPDLVSSGRNWQPSITTIGLYDDDNNLLVVGKLAKPIRKSTDLPFSVRVQVDL